MTQQEVNRLIDKYMEGKTSLEEERQLAIEVNRPDAPAEWKIVAEMLGELTWGEALYDEEMAARKRVRLHRYIGWSVAAVAACLTLWFVLGKFSAPTPQQDMIPQIAQQPTQMVKPEVPEEKEVSTVLTPASPTVEQVAYTPPAKRVKKHRRPARPAVEVVEQEDIPICSAAFWQPPETETAIFVSSGVFVRIPFMRKGCGFCCQGRPRRESKFSN